MKFATAALAGFATFLATPAMAEPINAGDLTIDRIAARATPANAPVSGGYMIIRNNGERADRLVGATASIADKVEIHEMAMDGDVMKMRELDDGLAIAPGEHVTLQPGGYHIMFTQLDGQLSPGATFEGTLSFENAGEIKVTWPVETLPEIRKMLGSDMEMKSMDHGGHAN
jgi:copper(I)-binding protein